MAEVDIGIAAAWARTLGRGVRVAVIDRGMDIAHPDLKDGFAAGGHFAADGRGATRFVPYRPGDDAFPTGNHGTFCLGVVGARPKGRTEGTGGAPECTLMPVACPEGTVTSQATLARAIRYAANPTLEQPEAARDLGADVISCSLVQGGAKGILEPVLRDAIDYAVTHGRRGRGTPIFWSVSNECREIREDAVCSHPNTIAVGASNRGDRQAGSAYGPELEFLAPGVRIYGTRQGGGYGFETGSSFAAPCAASIAALLLAVEPDLHWMEVRDRMRVACDKIGPRPYTGERFGGRNDSYGYGRVNAAATLGDRP